MPGVAESFRSWDEVTVAAYDGCLMKRSGRLYGYNPDNRNAGCWREQASEYGTDRTLMTCSSQNGMPDILIEREKIGNGTYIQRAARPSRTLRR